MKLARGLSSKVLLAAVVGLMLGCAEPGRAALDPAASAAYANALAGNAAGRFGALPPPANPVLDAVIIWDRLRRDGYSGSFAEMAALVRAYPAWPAIPTIRRRGERWIDASVPMAERIRFFEAFAPLSATGKFRYAEALLATGRREAALAMARDAWDSAGLDAEEEVQFLLLFGGSLTPDDYLGRADKLLWSGQTTAAGRTLPQLPPEWRAWAAARIALRTNSPDAAAAIAAVPAAQQSDPALIYDRVRWMMKAGDTVAARALMASAMVAPGSVSDADAWLELRTSLARTALRDNDNATAYRLVAEHRAFAPGRLFSERALGERQAFVDAEWLAGWIALQRQNRASAAYDHFRNVRAAALTPVTQSRADYWSGRAAAAAGRESEARARFTEAARHPDYFDGQLAHERIGKPIVIVRTAPANPGPDARRAFEADSLVQAARLLGEIGARDRQTVFMRALVEASDGADRQQLVADLSRSIGRPELGVLMGKAARAEGELALVDAAFPLLPLPDALSPSFTAIHAVTRQESQFDRAAVSGANARGLMQLLPGTAAETAAKLGLPYSLSRLTEDPIYNVTLGAAYFERMRGNLGGSWVLAAAAYNAGPGNVRKWVNSPLGDPRSAGIDVIDWIEMIPLSETRTYVQRVLENAVVYDVLHPTTAQMGTTNRLSGYLGKAAPG